jgi:hypothetical protein
MSRLFTNAWRRGLLLLVLALATAGAVRADEVTDWHEHMLAALQTAGVNPQFRTREAALVSAAVFDAVNGIQRRYTPIHVPAAVPRGASKRAAAVQAAYAVLVARFPAQAEDLGAKRDASLAAIGGAKGKSVRRGVEWGQTVAQAILDWRSTDGITPAPPPFLGGPEEGRWRPTPPANAAGAVPQLATMTPWGILSPNQFRPLGPPGLDTEEYAIDLIEVMDMGSASSTLRTADQTDAALFAAASTPTFLWNRLALDLIAEREDHEDEEDGEGADLLENARLLATLNLAMADAAIACWDSKYFYEFWRPITAIRLGDIDGDGNPDDPGWTPLLVTPAHPEYASGHSTLSSAGATVLAEYFGENTPFSLESQGNPDWVRFYPNFSTAVDEIADARVFAGIHFRTACEDGAALGSDVANHILENLMQRIHGRGNDRDND